MKIRAILSWAVILALFLMAGCGGFGPQTVSRDRFDYTDAISESWKRQMLLNMVKIRYADSPVFLDVGSVINQYLMETEIQGSLSWNAFLPEPSQNIGARGRYADRPTITYQPLVGEKFTRSLMTPIPPDAILSLVEAGWRADLVFRLCVQSTNGLYNSAASRMPVRPADAEFYRMISSFRKIQESMAVGTRIQKATDEGPGSVLFFRNEGIPAEIQTEIDSARKLLGLNPELDEFSIIYGALAKGDDEIAILTRSMLQILSELGAYIEVPQIHAEQNRATGNFLKASDVAAGVAPLMRVQADKEPPGDAFVTVQYRGYWFWIDDKDYQSKKMFSFLMFLFSLAETGAPAQAPVLTIPTG